jgi:hypothetical protein
LDDMIGETGENNDDWLSSEITGSLELKNQSSNVSVWDKSTIILYVNKNRTKTSKINYDLQMWQVRK